MKSGSGVSIEKNLNSKSSNNNLHEGLIVDDDSYDIEKFKSKMDKFTKNCNEMFENYEKTSGKDNKDHIQIDISNTIDDIEDELKQFLTNNKDSENNKNYIEYLNSTIYHMKEKLNIIKTKRVNYDPRESLLLKTEDEKRIMRMQKEKELNKIYEDGYHQAKKLKKGAQAVGDVLEEDKIKVNEMSKKVGQVADKIEKTEVTLEGYLSKSFFMISVTEWDLWKVAIGEFIVLLLLLAI